MNIKIDNNENSKINKKTILFSNEEYQDTVNNILSPSVKKATNYFFKLLNKYIKVQLKQGNKINKICIELAKEANSLEVRKNIAEYQKINEKKNKEVEELLAKKNLSEVSRGMRQKILL
jgi:hypothetical protein